MRYPAHEIVKAFKSANWQAQYKTPFGELDTNALAEETVQIENQLLKLQQALNLAMKYVPKEIKTRRGLFTYTEPNPDYQTLKQTFNTKQKG